ncbi:hypothetical protein CV950_007850 [Acinetobacter baumannii]|nr:hypothetical protein CV950_007850 [Acinetobacter baumannii]
MSTQELDHNHRYEIKSPDDVSQLISKFAGKGKSNKVIWLALIGVFIDAEPYRVCRRLFYLS